MEELLANPTFGNPLSNGSIAGVGFNHGSDTKQAFIGIDWLETSLLNDGNRIDFADPAASNFPTVTMGGATVGGTSGVTSAPSGWTWGIGSATEPAQVMTRQLVCLQSEAAICSLRLRFDGLQYAVDIKYCMSRMSSNAVGTCVLEFP